MEYIGNQKVGFVKAFFRSRVRAGLALNFFLNVSGEFYIRELARKFGTSAGNIKRELAKLEELRIVKKRKLANIVLYQADKGNPAFKYWRSMVFENAGLTELLRPILLISGKVEVAFIYGSFAKGEYDSSSDIDLMIIIREEFTREEYAVLNSKIAQTEEMVGREINFDIYTRHEFTAKSDNRYLIDVLGNKKIFVIGGKDELRF